MKNNSLRTFRLGLVAMGISAMAMLAPLRGWTESVVLKNATATFSQQSGWNVSTIIDGITNDVAGWSVYNFGVSGASSEIAVVETESNVGHQEGSRLSFKLYQVNHNPQHTLGRFRLSYTTDPRDTFADGLNSGGDVSATWNILTPTSASGTGGETLTIQSDGSVLVSGENPAKTIYTLTAEVSVQGITGFRIEAMEDSSLPASGPGRYPSNGNFALTEFMVDASPLTNQPPPTLVNVVLKNPTATISQAGGWNASLLTDGVTNDYAGWAVYDFGRGGAFSESAVVESETNIGFASGSLLVFSLYHVNHNPQHGLGRFRISYTTDSRDQFADGQNSGGDVTANWIVITPKSASGTGGETFAIQPDGSILVTGANPTNTVYTVTAEVAATGITGFRIEALEDPVLPSSGPGRYLSNGNFVLTEFTAGIAALGTPPPPPPPPAPTQIVLRNAAATFSQAGGWNVSSIIDGVTNSSVAWSVYDFGRNGAFGETAVVETETNIGYTGGSLLTFVLYQVNHNPQHTLGRFRISYTTDSRDSFADGLNSGGDVTANWTVLTPKTASAAGGTTLTIQNDGSILAGGDNPSTTVYNVTSEINVLGITGFRIETMEDSSLPAAGPGRYPSNGNFALTEFAAFVSPLSTNQPPPPPPPPSGIVSLQNPTATLSQAGGWNVDSITDGITNNSVAWSIYDFGLNGAKQQTAVVETVSNIGFASGSRLTFALYQVNHNPQHTLGRFRLSYTMDNRDTFADGLNSGGDVTANWFVLIPTSASGTGGETLTIQPDGSILASGANPTTTVYTVTADVLAQGITGFRIEALEDPSLPASGPGRYPSNGNFALTEFMVSIAPLTNTTPVYLSEFDLSSGYSTDRNPNGPWSFGWTETLDGYFHLLGHKSNFASENGVTIMDWRVSATAIPAVSKVIGPGVAISAGGAFTAPSGTVYATPGNDGTTRNFATIRFTVPTNEAGVYRIESAVRPIFDGDVSGDSDFHVVKNGDEIFGIFLPPNTPSGYTNQLVLQAGDTVDFVTGRGADGLHADRTALKIRAWLGKVAAITSLPPAAVIYDLARDFSPTANPAGVWTYGAKPSLDGPFSTFGIRGLNPFEYWQLVASQEPTIYRNGTSQTITNAGGQGVFPPKTTFLYSGTDGASNAFGAVRFTSPRTTNYAVTVTARPVYNGPIQGDTDLHIFTGSQELFGAFLAPAESRIYSNIISLAQGQTLDVMVGRGQDGSGTASGLKLDVRLIQTADLPPLPPPPAVPAPAGLAGWWPLDGNAADKLNRNNGTLIGAPAFTSGKVSLSMIFDGANDSVRIPASRSLDVGSKDGFTIEAWIRPSSLSHLRPLVEWNHGNIGAHLWTGVDTLAPGDGTRNLFANIIDTSGVSHQIRTEKNLVSEDSWQHVALTYDKGSGLARILFNGRVAAETNLGTFTPETRGNLYLGNRPSGPFAGIYWLGEMDEVTLYHRALVPAELFAIYGAGASGKITPTNAPSLNTPPVAKALASPLFTVWQEQTNLQIIAADGLSAAAVLDGALSSDADGDSLTFLWTKDDEGSPFAGAAITTNSLSAGHHHVTLVVDDGTDDHSDTLEIEVITLTEAVAEIHTAISESGLPRKDKRPLFATLERIAESFADGRLHVGTRQLRAFQQKVRAQVAGHSPELADRLRSAAGQIIDAIETYLESEPDAKDSLR